MATQIELVIAELGGKQVLGRMLLNEQDIREGFPPQVVEELMQSSGLTLKELTTVLDLSPPQFAAPPP